LANTPNSYGLLLFARFLIGLGAESLYFATTEVYGEVFPHNFGTMIGISGLLSSFESFAAFQVLPIVANSRSDVDLDSSGTDSALLLIVLLCLVSTIATYAVAVGLFLEKRNKREAGGDIAVLESTFGALAKAMIPSAAKGLASLKLPRSFYLTVFGLKAVWYFANTFSLYSVDLYARRYGLSQSEASLATGITSLIATPLSLVMGFLTDKIGARARLNFVAACFGLAALVILLSSDGSTVVWVATVLFAIMTSYADLAIVTIPLIVGPARAGLGYGMYSILGNTIDALNAYIAGVLLELPDGDGDTIFLLYSSVIAGVGVLCFVGVYLLEKDVSFMESPISHIIETSLGTLHSASMCSVIVAASPDDESGKGELNATGRTLTAEI
jgi:MFS family permease